MAMNHKEIYELSHNTDFAKYVVGGMIKYAQSIIVADPGAQPAAVTNKRLSLAQSVLRDYTQNQKTFVINLAALNALNKDITYDEQGLIVYAPGDLSAAINTYIDLAWNYLAGVTYEDLNS